MKVFISYRRDDSQWPADRLYAAIREFVPNPDEDLFMDVHDIPQGVDFKEHIEKQVGQCNVVLVLIGSKWLDVKKHDSQARRLDDPNDVVRLEIATALRRDIRVVPILLDGTPVPSAADLPDDIQALARRNGIEVRLSSFDSDVQRLLRGLGLKKRGPARRNLLLGGAAAASVALVATSVATRWPPMLYGGGAPLPQHLQLAVERAEEARELARRAASEGDGARTEAEAEKNRAEAPDAGEEFEAGVERVDTGRYAGRRRAPGVSVHGVFEHPSGAKYAGSWLGFSYDGPGRFNTGNAEGVVMCTGRFAANVLNGPGELRYADNSVFLGIVVASEPAGAGIMLHSDGAYLAGEFLGGKLSGPGVEFKADGRVSRAGIWRNGLLGGEEHDSDSRTPSEVTAAIASAREAESEAARIAERGRQSAALAHEFAANARAASEAQRPLASLELTAYSGYGEFAGQQRTFDGALGVYTRADACCTGEIYAGAWTGGDFSHSFGGFGVYQFPQSSPGMLQQAGRFVENQQSGRGEIQFTNGRRYRGDVRADVAAGWGVTTFPDGVTHVGAHADGRLDGAGAEFDAEGRVTRYGVWRAGELATPG